MARRVLLDANVLVPISLCDVLLILADERMIRPLWSGQILGEVRKSLVEDIGLSEVQAANRVNQMAEAFPAGMVTGFEPLIPLMGNDPKDRHVLAAAVKADCAIIVTENLKDFKASALAPHRVVAVRPDDLLLDLWNEDQDSVVEALDRKCRTYRHPPMTVVDLADRLTGTVPRFANTIKMRPSQGARPNRDN
jgi:predicted nucleic acid-binding protein